MKVVNVVGKKGEEVAVVFLQKKGYKIIERNFHCRLGEIDIVAVKDSTLVFVEVKTRTTKQFGLPIEAIGYSKIQSIIRTGQLYSFTHRGLPEGMRIDAVVVTLSDTHEVRSIELVENIGE